MLNPAQINQLQADAGKLGVALALPEYIHRLTPESQNHVVFTASQELVRLRHKRCEELLERVGFSEWSVEEQATLAQLMHNASAGMQNELPDTTDRVLSAFLQLVEGK